MLTTILGLLIGLAAILAGQALEGGSLSSLLQPTAALIVIGGTVGAVVLQSSPGMLWQGLRMLSWLVVSPEPDFERRVKALTEYRALVKKEGLLALESRMQKESDPFFQRGLRMVSDGANEEDIYQVLSMDVAQWDTRLKQASKIWDAAGGYSPTIGILGAVLGLIHVMENLADPAKLGAGIAVAFVATVYGVGLANLVYLPIAKRLQGLLHTQKAFRLLTIEGLCAIARGDSALLLEERLASFEE